MTILSIEQLREMARFVVAIPDFENKGTIDVRLQRPSLMAMATKGQIPNHLISIATESLGGAKKQKNEELAFKDAGLLMELYLLACLVEPAYEEFKDIITDQQSDFIFRWAMGQVDGLNSFREEQAVHSSVSDGKEVSKITE